MRDAGCACWAIILLRLFCNFNNLYLKTFEFDQCRLRKSMRLCRPLNQFLVLAIFLTEDIVVVSSSDTVPTKLLSFLI
jgi:hypothetical protein